MDKLLMFIGGIWAALGVGNVIAMDWAKSEQGFQVFGLIFNFLVFVFPGLVVFGIGAVMSKKRAPRSQTTPSASSPKVEVSIEVRLKQLEDLKARGVISPEEYETRRIEILREV